MRWSQLKKLLENIFAPELNLQIHCSSYRSQDGAGIGRYWILLDKAIIFDEPKNISQTLKSDQSNQDASVMTGLIRSYLDTPKGEIFTREFPDDRWALIEILRAADRRIGKRRLQELYQVTNSEAVKAIIEARNISVLI